MEKRINWYWVSLNILSILQMAGWSTYDFLVQDISNFKVSSFLFVLNIIVLIQQTK